MDISARVLQITSQVSMLPEDQINPLLIGIYEKVQDRRRHLINQHLDQIKALEDSYDELTSSFMLPGCKGKCEER